MEEWYLKLQDGSVFGPINLATLREWAAQGRVSPDDTLSSDGDRWKSPHELAELEMHWIVELPDATTYGPISIGVVALFLEEGRILPDATVVDTTTGEKQSAHAIAHPPTAPEDDTTKQLEETNRDLCSRVDKLDQRNADLTVQLDSANKKLTDSERLRSMEKDRNAKSERELRLTIERLERNASESNRRLEKMGEKLKQAQMSKPASVNWMSSQAPAPSPPPPEPGPDKIEMAKREAELLQQIDRLNTDADVAASRIAELEKRDRTRQRDHENLRLRGINRAAEDKKKLTAAAEQTEALQQQIKTMTVDASAASAHATDLQTQLRDQQQAHEKQTSIMARQATQLEAKVSDALIRAEESQRREGELSKRIEKDATAAQALQKQLVDLREALEQERSRHAAHRDESQQREAEHAHTIEQLQLACGELATQLNEVRERAADETATLKQSIEEAIAREERLRHTLEEMDQKLQSELVHPEVLPKEQDQDASSASTPAAPNISDIEDQLQRELHELKNKQTQEGGSIGSILSSWKRKD